MIHALIVGGIIVAIALGYKTNLNTGLFGIVLAYILGAFVMGLKTSEVIGLWPTTIFFVYLSVSLFFGMAGANGTMKKVAGLCLQKDPRFDPLRHFLWRLGNGGNGRQRSGFCGLHGSHRSGPG